MRHLTSSWRRPFAFQKFEFPAVGDRQNMHARAKISSRHTCSSARPGPLAIPLRVRRPIKQNLAPCPSLATGNVQSEKGQCLDAADGPAIFRWTRAGRERADGRASCAIPTHPKAGRWRVSHAGRAFAPEKHTVENQTRRHVSNAVRRRREAQAVQHAASELPREAVPPGPLPACLLVGAKQRRFPPHTHVYTGKKKTMVAKAVAAASLLLGAMARTGLAAASSVEVPAAGGSRPIAAIGVATGQVRWRVKDVVSAGRGKILTRGATHPPSFTAHCQPASGLHRRRGHWPQRALREGLRAQRGSVQAGQK